MYTLNSAQGFAGPLVRQTPRTLSLGMRSSELTSQLQLHQAHADQNLRPRTEPQKVQSASRLIYLRFPKATHRTSTNLTPSPKDTQCQPHPLLLLLVAPLNAFSPSSQPYSPTSKLPPLHHTPRPLPDQHPLPPLHPLRRLSPLHLRLQPRSLAPQHHRPAPIS
jgi:hypothetical protein